MEKCISILRTDTGEQKENLLAINAHEICRKNSMILALKDFEVSNKNLDLLFLQRYCIDIFRKKFKQY